MAFRFENLDIWHMAKEYASKVYLLTAKFPRHEDYGLRSQMNRAVTNQAKIEKTSSYNLPCPLFRKEGNSPPFSKGRWGGIISGVYTIMDSLVIL